MTDYERANAVSAALREARVMAIRFVGEAETTAFSDAMASLVSELAETMAELAAVKLRIGEEMEKRKP